MLSRVKHDNLVKVYILLLLYIFRRRLTLRMGQFLLWDALVDETVLVKTSLTM